MQPGGRVFVAGACRLTSALLRKGPGGLECRQFKCAQEANRMSRAIKPKWPLLAAPLLGLTLLVGSQAAVAKGCIKGAVVGGVAGHVAGHHAVAGAAVGCVVGHHLAKKKQRQQERQQPQPPVPAPGQQAPEQTQT